MTTTLTRPRNAWRLEPAQAERADAEDLVPGQRPARELVAGIRDSE